MPSAQDSSRGHSARILVVCLPYLERGIRRLLGGLCHADWQRLEMVRLHVLAPEQATTKASLTTLIDRIAPREKFVQVWVQSHIELEATLVRAYGPKVLRPPIRRFSCLIALRKELPQVLFGMGLDWQACVVGSLSSGWVHGTTPLDRDRVDLWLDQFLRLGGDNRWIGEGLLRVLDFWLPNRQRLALGLTRDIVPLRGNH